MGLKVVASEVAAIGDGLWLVAMPPHQVRMFGEPRQAVGPRSVLLLTDAEFDKASGSLTFDADHVIVLNIGTDARAIIIGSENTDGIPQAVDDSQRAYGPGDREFLRLAEALPIDMQRAAEQLLAGVRSRWPGDLKRGLQRNFSNTPDNFWYVIVQPRANELSVTVRGEPSHFKGLTELTLKVDRPGYSRFKVTGPHDVPAALKIIGSSRRKS